MMTLNAYIVAIKIKDYYHVRSDRSTPLQHALIILAFFNMEFSVSFGIKAILRYMLA